MPTNLRRLGVYGKNLPTKKAKTIEPSDFLIGGLIGKFERAYNTAFEIRNPSELQEVFGKQILSSTYGYDSALGFFNNTVGVDAKLVVVSHVGYTGSAIDGVNATASIVDGTPATVLTLKSAYQGELEYGTSGNRTGYTITNGSRFTTGASATALATAYTCTLDSVIGVKVGDIVKFSLTGGAPATAYHKITAVDESAKSITWTDSVLHATSTLAISDVIEVLGFRLRVWRKDTNGIVTEVDTELGKIYCTTESEVTDYYVENVFSTSNWVAVERLSTSPATLDLTLPVNVSTVTYMTSGAIGTAPTTSAHWSNDLTLLDNTSVRFIANPESTDRTIQLAMETYCRARTDTPKVIFNIGSDKTKAQLITEGGLWQRSDDVLGVIVSDWLKITDPFATSSIAPARIIPNVGHVMGCYIRTIGTQGIHVIPQKDTPIFGIIGLDNDNIVNITDVDRTDIAQAGINIIQNITGYGYVIRNFFTPSITQEFQFLNGIVMRDYIKISVVDSLQSSENQPNSYQRIQQDKTAVENFLINMWFRGSTGSVREGETFGQTTNTDGSVTTFDQHFEVIADLTNNPQSSINAGQRNLDVYFSYPAPAGSIQIGVGILVLS